MAERDLVVRIIGDEDAYQRSLRKAAGDTTKFANNLERPFSRAGTKSATAFHKAFSKSAFVGGLAGGGAALLGESVLQGLRGSVEAAAESQRILGQTRIALEATGKSWSEYGKEIENAIAAQSKLGFDDEDLLKVFSLLVRQTKDVGEALRRLGLVTDLSRARFISLEQAAQLVVKAGLGQAGALRRVGIDARAGASGVELLAQLSREFGGAASKAAKDASTSFDRLNVQLENAQESLGTLALPIMQNFAEVAGVAADRVTQLTDALGGLETNSDHLSFGDVFSSFADLPDVFVKSLKPPWKWKDVADSQAKQLTSDLARSFEKNVPTLTDALSGAFDKAGTANPADFSKLPGVDTGAPIAQAFGASVRAFITAAQDEVDKAVTAGNKAIASDRAEKAAETRRQSFERLIASLQLNVDRTALTKRLDDDLAKLNALKAGLERQVKAGVDVQAAQSQLVAVTGDIAAKQTEIRQAAADALQARQFRALGLSGSGEEIVPGLENLTKRLKGALARISSGDLDVGSKLADRLKAAQKLIRTEGGKLTEETRRQMDAFLKAATGQDSNAKDGPLTATSSFNANKIIEGLGLDASKAKEIKARLSSFNTAGVSLAGDERPTGAFASVGGTSVGPVDVTLTMDGDVVARNTLRRNERTGRRNPRSKRGGV